ncbi:GntR family transcriptional regulator [Lipingzhangella sp. LS1_29]|uniref:GntR family transcriptional regulator n=1 Tax=Lipingzhangella rawalii TaxID=2055835 RepID=A0ABU2HAS2_9ACTN|nr:GntR family transcriptional regulator [Lipingzhangella rawalii]MDS1272425.1 GntR family transcriptional regulator [Lipingzhangella rawalii]
MNTDIPSGGTDSRPLHARIAADLREEILSGTLPPGSALPSTTQLTHRFGAANATIQKALAQLKSEGLVVGRAGANVQVRPHRQETIRPADYLTRDTPAGPHPWVSQAAQQGRRGRSHLLTVTETTPPADVATALQLDAHSRVMLRAQLLTLDDEPAELVHAYYPLEIARSTALTEFRRIKGGAPALLTELGYPPRRTCDRVSARVPDQETFARLRLPGDLPVLRTLRVLYTDHDCPIEATVMAKAGHRYELHYELHPT